MRREWRLWRVPTIIAFIGAMALGAAMGLGLLSVPATYGGMYLVILLFGGMVLRTELTRSDDG